MSLPDPCGRGKASKSQTDSGHMAYITSLGLFVNGIRRHCRKRSKPNHQEALSSQG